MKISIAMATYNGAKYLQKQLDSFVVQTRRPDELIICDDGSSDDTVKMLSAFAEQAPFDVHLHCNQINLGFVQNFSKALSLCTGDLVFLSDQDDVWFDHKIEYMLQPFINYEDVGLVYSDAVLTNSELEPTEHTLFGRRKSLMVDKVRSAPMLVKGVGINGCTMAFRLALKELVLPIEKGWGHDHWIVFIAHAVTVVTPVGQPLMYYRRHGDSAGNDPFLEGGRVRAWKTGINAVSLDEYERDLCRWEAMFQRLHEIEEKRSVTWVDYTNLGVFLRECERRTELARLRKRMKEKGRLNRLPDVFRIFSSGYYHQYLHGMKSLAKDLLIQ